METNCSESGVNLKLLHELNMIGQMVIMFIISLLLIKFAVSFFKDIGFLIVLPF